MTLYEIDDRLMSLVDQETGEILDKESFDTLVMERDHKVEGVALWIKNETAMADALAGEIKKLQDRKKVCENRVTRLKDYLKYALEGEKFATPKVSVSFRSGSKTEVTDWDAFYKWTQTNKRNDLLRMKDPEPNKTAIADALKKGEKIPGTETQPSVSVLIR